MKISRRGVRATSSDRPTPALGRWLKRKRDPQLQRTKTAGPEDNKGEVSSHIKSHLRDSFVDRAIGLLVRLRVPAGIPGLSSRRDPAVESNLRSAFSVWHGKLSPRFRPSDSSARSSHQDLHTASGRHPCLGVHGIPRAFSPRMLCPLRPTGAARIDLLEPSRLYPSLFNSTLIDS